MYVDPLVPITPDRQKTASWPKYQWPRRIEYMPLSRALTIEHPTDAHAGAYSVPGIPHRLCTDPPAYERIAGGVPMVLFHWDIDCDASHKAAGGDARVAAGDAWWEATRPRIEEMLGAHPGGFVFRTRGGAHIIYRLPVPLVITDGASEIDWKRRYLASLASLARRFKLVCDPSVSDWPRLMRLPHVMRDGVMQRLETMGDPFDVAPFVYEPTHADELADLSTVRALGSKWSPTLRILARNATPPQRSARAPRLVEPRAVDVGTLNALAQDLGRALRRHHGRHGVHLALAGACYARGIPLDQGASLARAICAASGETDDRPQVWQTTADRVRSGQQVTSYGHLAEHWPDLAAIVDAALPSGGGAQAIRDALDARGVVPAIAAPDAAAAVRAALTDAPPGLSVVRVTEGAGKTRAAVDVLRARAEAVGDRESVPSRMKTLYVASSHAVALEVASSLRGLRGQYLRGILSVRDAQDGEPACQYHVPLSRLTASKHAAQTWCEGKHMGHRGADAPCPHYDGCAARAGTVVELGGAGTPAVVVTVHALLAQGLAWAGADALVVIDEDPQAVESVELLRSALDTAASAEALFARSERWRAPILRALAAGLERGEIPQGAGSLREVFERGCEALLGDAAWCAAVRESYPSDGDDLTHPRDMLHVYAIRAAWSESKPDPKAPPKWRRRSAWAPRPSRAEHGRVFSGQPSERFVEASRTHAEVARLVAGVVRSMPVGCDGHAERGVAVVEVSHADATRRVLRGVMASPAVTAALHRYGPTVLLDATADVAIVRALAQGDVPVIDVRVRDGAPVTRRLLYWSGASRKTAFEGGSVRWGEGLERYLRAALAHVVGEGSRRVGVFSWKALSDVLSAAQRGGDGVDPVAAAIVRDAVAQGVELVVGHYGHARGRNDWSSCDALVSIGDPRPNVGSSRAIAAVLGLAEEHAEVYRRATAAEVSQVAGRLRAPWRTTSAVHVHVGTVTPASWDASAEVLELPKGIGVGVDCAAVLDAVRVYGSARVGAAATGVGRTAAKEIAADSRKPLAQRQLHTGRSNADIDTKTAAVRPVRNTLENKRFDDPAPSEAHPAPGDRALIDAVGGASAAARLLGVDRATVYHWWSGRRPMPTAARQSLTATRQSTVTGDPTSEGVEAPAGAPAVARAVVRFTAPVVAREDWCA